jgi:Fe-S cluster biogenesis protein NfuA/nitrite reductase/ring-hydroxylating ferredoxin subunit
MAATSNHHEGTPMTKAKDLRAVGERIDGLLEEFAAVADPRMRERAEELVRLLMELYGGALDRVLRIVDEAGRSDEIMDRLGSDDLVGSLLVLHNLHPLDVKTRILRALDRVRPYLGSHGGDVKLVRVADGVAYLRLEGSCHGCPSSTITMKLAVEKAIEEAAPEVARIEVEGATDAAPAASSGNKISKNDPAQTEEGRVPSGEWHALGQLPEFAHSNLAATALGGMNVLVCRVGETFYAYQDSCPACGVALRENSLRGNFLTCFTCGRRYDVRRAGQCTDGGDLHMAPLPLLAQQSEIRIAIPAISS